MEVAEADMLNLPFDNESFDVVIEKGAMVGSILILSYSASLHYVTVGGMYLFIFNFFSGGRFIIFQN